MNTEAWQNVTGSCTKKECILVEIHTVKKTKLLPKNLLSIRLQNVKSQFTVKSKKPHPSCVINKGKCLCEEEHIGETEKNVEKR